MLKHTHSHRSDPSNKVSAQSGISGPYARPSSPMRVIIVGCSENAATETISI